MDEPSKYLESSWKQRSCAAQERVLKAIAALKAEGEPVNFNTVHMTLTSNLPLPHKFFLI